MLGCPAGCLLGFLGAVMLGYLLRWLSLLRCAVCDAMRCCARALCCLSDAMRWGSLCAPACACVCLINQSLTAIVACIVAWLNDNHLRFTPFADPHRGAKNGIFFPIGPTPHIFFDPTP